MRRGAMLRGLSVAAALALAAPAWGQDTAGCAAEWRQITEAFPALRGEGGLPKLARAEVGWCVVDQLRYRFAPEAVAVGLGRLKWRGAAVSAFLAGKPLDGAQELRLERLRLGGRSGDSVDVGLVAQWDPVARSLTVAELSVDLQDDSALHLNGRLDGVSPADAATVLPALLASNLGALSLRISGKGRLVASAEAFLAPVLASGARPADLRPADLRKAAQAALAALPDGLLIGAVAQRPGRSRRRSARTQGRDCRRSGRAGRIRPVAAGLFPRPPRDEPGRDCCGPERRGLRRRICARLGPVTAALA